MTRFLITAKKYLLFILILSFALVLSTGKYAYAVTDGVKLWACYLLPSFFPYLFITAVFSSLPATFSLSEKLSPLTKKLFGVNGSVAYAFMMSVISGYPMGSKVVADLKTGGYLSERESMTAAALASTSSPAFTVGVVGNIIFRDTLFGVLLFLVNIVSAIITGLIFSISKRDKNNRPLSVAHKETPSFYDLTYSSVISILVIGGIIALFYLLSEILLSAGVLTPFINVFSSVSGDAETGKAITFGLLEFTRGLKILGGTARTVFTLPIAAFLCGFSGLSAVMQSLCYLKKAKIKTAPYLISRLTHAVVSFLLALTVSFFL